MPIPPRGDMRAVPQRPDHRDFPMGFETSTAVRIECQECETSWRYGCPDCGQQFADYHRDQTGHTVEVVAAHASRFSLDQVKVRGVRRRRNRQWP